MRLVRQLAEYTISLKELEDNLLARLAASQASRGRKFLVHTWCGCTGSPWIQHARITQLPRCRVTSWRTFPSSVSTSSLGHPARGGTGSVQRPRAVQFIPSI